MKDVPFSDYSSFTYNLKWDLLCLYIFFPCPIQICWSEFSYRLHEIASFSSKVSNPNLHVECGALSFMLPPHLAHTLISALVISDSL